MTFAQPQSQCLRPDAKRVGLLDGLPVYRTADVSELRTAGNWIRHRALQVKAGEQPYRRTMRRKAPQRSGRKQRHDTPTDHASTVGDSNIETESRIGSSQENQQDDADKTADTDTAELDELFGDWQTEKFVPPPAVDDKVPKNEYGNVEFWDQNPAHLPAGCAHVEQPWIQQTCNEEGIDFAEAMTGFKYSADGMKPKIEGIIVCSKDLDRLLDAHRVRMDAKHEVARLKREGQLAKRWKDLINLVVSLDQISREYQ